MSSLADQRPELHVSSLADQRPKELQYMCPLWLIRDQRSYMCVLFREPEQEFHVSSLADQRPEELHVYCILTGVCNKLLILMSQS